MVADKVEHEEGHAFWVGGFDDQGKTPGLLLEREGHGDSISAQQIIGRGNGLRMKIRPAPVAEQLADATLKNTEAVVLLIITCLDPLIVEIPSACLALSKGFMRSVGERLTAVADP